MLNISRIFSLSECVLFSLFLVPQFMYQYSIKQYIIVTLVSNLVLIESLHPKNYHIFCSSARFRLSHGRIRKNYTTRVCISSTRLNFLFKSIAPNFRFTRRHFVFLLILALILSNICFDCFFLSPSTDNFCISID